MNKEICVVLGFDMETDVGSFTPFYEGLKNGTPKILRLLRKKKVDATFFFTGEAAQKFPRIVKEVASSGYEVGCHTMYHETVGEEIFEIPGIRPILPEEVPLRLKMATEVVSNVLGEKTVSFRCPRLFGSTTVVNTLNDMGYAADASYPLYFHKRRFIPYHPSRLNWCEEGNLDILEIPNFADMTIKSKDRYGRDRDQWPIFRTKGSDKLMVHINNFLGLVHGKGLPAVLCFYFHPWEFVKMKDIFHFGEATVIPDKFITKNCGEYALGELEKLIERLKELNAKFYSAKNLAKYWKNR